MYRYTFLLISLFVLISFSSHGAQNKNTITLFEQKLIKMGLVDIQTVSPSIIVDLKYSTTDNFLKQDVYGDLDRCYLQKAAAIKLAEAQKVLKKYYPKYSLIVYDGARPRSIQRKMWQIVKGTSQQKYVANPDRGSIHNYGCAVDLSIVDENKQELDMGTVFDFFGPLAQPRFEEFYFKKDKLTSVQIKNRKLLRTVLNKAGFQGILSEWWHFNAFPIDVVKKRYKIIE